MKIIYNISTTAANGGGMERITAEKANYLAEVYGHELIIITTDQGKEPTFYPISPKVRYFDIGLNYHEITKIKNFFYGYYLYRKALIVHRRKLEKILMQEKADIVVSLGRDEKEFLYKIKDGSKKILESHRCLKPRARIEFRQAKSLIMKIKIIYRLIHETRLPKYYDKFILETEEDKLFWKEKKNAMVIPNPLPFNPVEVSTLEYKRVLSVGRISIDKGIDRMLVAWKLVAANFPDWRLSLVGDVVDKQILTQIETLELQNSVEILPPTPKIMEEYLKSSIYVMTSRFEGFGMVLIEAMGCGVPNVSYAFKCGPRDIITDNEDGFLVEEDDAVTFAQKLSLLMQDKKLRKEMGSKAKVNVQRFSVERVMQKWDDLFHELTR